MTLSISKPTIAKATFQQRQMLEEFHHMLTYMRPAGTKTEELFVKTFVDNLPGVMADGYGNRHIILGNTNVLWSSHTDSVHHEGGRQVVLKRDGVFKLKPQQPKKPACLGADCATGVWIMRQMILRGIPGHYIFHRDEECGGLGSSWLAKNDPGLLDGVDIAIAFDRKGYDSVITYQGHRTASDAFAKSLASQLGGKYAPDDTGLFTDTAKYTDIIPECSNVSVGYHSAHSAQEWQDYDFALELLEKVCAIDTGKLAVERDPKVVEYGWSGGRRWTDYYDSWDDFDIRSGTGMGVSRTATTYSPSYGSNSRSPFYDDLTLEGESGDTFRRSTSGSNFSELYQLLLSYPEEVANVLDEMGLDAEDINDLLCRYRR